MLGLIGTQRVVAKSPHSNSELGAIAKARLDFLGNPSADGNYYSFQTDRNASTSTATNSEAYTTMTNWLALTFQSSFGYAIGKPQTVALRKEVKDPIHAFLTDLWDEDWIGDPNNPTVAPFIVTLDDSNNSDAQVALGVMQASIRAKYLSTCANS
ncbi:hypothetical protein [Paraburkholderia sp.]|uniref:hypothetical protein n=1 Tax=Paraburkholderia sp. TaxID=1926495 RepID=UPI002384EE82|nr:hypothetical protein [Paraburkholderia sp.]MDE1179499.1 hypothetical protein [Paraburkholderia sp.]